MALIRNIGRVALSVGIIDEKGNKGFVRVMSRGKGVNLAANERIDPLWMTLNGKDIRVFQDSATKTADLASSVQQLNNVQQLTAQVSTVVATPVVAAVESTAQASETTTQ